jgi:hypothetical protein
LRLSLDVGFGFGFDLGLRSARDVAQPRRQLVNRSPLLFQLSLDVAQPPPRAGAHCQIHEGQDERDDE